MPNKKINQLVSKTSILSTDLFPIGDATSGQLYKKTVAELQAAIGGAVISVNGLVGTVVLDTDDIQELATPTNKYFTDARARAAVSATSPLVFNSSTGVFSMPAATTSVNGYLTSTDWNTFNGKENALTFSSPLVRTSNTISIPVATTSVNGYLSFTDWTTFNNKQGALTLTVSGSSGASTLVGTTLNIPTYTLAGLGGITASFLSAGAGITYSSSTGIIASTITQYTDALARASLSFTAGSGAYNSTTGVITIPTNTSQLTNGAAFITLTSLSGSTGITYNSTTGAISSTITQYTDALARAAVSLTTTGTSGASTYNSTTGVLNIPNYGSALSGYLPLTGGTLTGALGGTSATFSSSLTSQSGIIQNATGNNSTLSIYRGTSQTYGARITALDIDGSVSFESIGDAVGPNIYFKLRTLGTPVTALTIASTGSATISGSVTAQQGLCVSGYGGLTNSANKFIIDFFSGNSRLYSLGTNTTTKGGYEFHTNSSDGSLDVIALKIDSSSNVGIGSSSPAGKLTVLGANSAGISIDQGSYNYYGAYNHIFLSTGYTTEYLRIANTGNLLVGTTTDSGYKLDVNGTGRFSGAFYLTTSATLTMSNSANTSNFDIGLLGGNTDANAYIYQRANSNLYIGTNNTTRLTIASTGAATFSSSVTATSGTFVTSGTKSTVSIGNTATSTYSQLLMYGGATKYNWSLGAQYNTNNAFEITPSTVTEGTTFSTPVVTILQSGNVGIGTTSPNGKLDVANGGDVSIWATATSAGSASLYLYPNGGGLAEIGAVGAVNMKFTTNSTERMRIGSTGLVAIGTTNTGYGNLGVYAATNTLIGIANSTSYAQLQQNGADLYINTNLSGATGGNLIFRFGSTSAEFMRIVSTGNILLGTTTDNGERLYVSGAIRATGTITANSDIRLKKNLERIENALEKVGQISGYTYNTIYDDKRHGGVIAQEIDEVFPEIVNKGNDGLLGVEYGNISALLIEALKEATTKIKALESKVEALQK